MNECFLLGGSPLFMVTLQLLQLREVETMVSVMAALTIDRTRVVHPNNFPLVLPLGIAWLLVFISIGVASSLR